MHAGHEGRRAALRRLLLALGVQNLATGPSHALDRAIEGAGGRPRSFQEILGLNVKFAQGQPASQLPLLADLNVRWVRDTVLWQTLEPKAGLFQPFPADFDERLRFYRSHGIGVVFILAYGNPLAYPPTAEQPDRDLDPFAFGRYAAEVSRRLRAAKVEFVLDIWNEPHNFGLRPRLGGAWNGRPPSPWVDRYVQMVHQAVRQVKAVDAGIRLLSDDDMWVLHYWFLEKGLPRDLDGFAFHPYVNESSPGPEVAAVSADTEWMRPFVAVDADRSFTSAVRRLRAHGAARLGRTPQMWATEWGWAIGQATPLGPADEDSVAGLLPRAFIVAEAAGVEALCWFSMQDSVDGPMGLITNDGRRRKTYQAYKTLAEQLGAYERVAQTAGRDTPTKGLQAFVFRRGGASKTVVWCVEPPARMLTWADDGSDAAAVNALGQPVTIERGADGTRRIEVSTSPLYITGLLPGATFAGIALPAARPARP